MLMTPKPHVMPMHVYDAKAAREPMHAYDVKTIFLMRPTPCVCVCVYVYGVKTIF